MGGEYLQVSRLAESPGESFRGVSKKVKRCHNALDLGYEALCPRLYRQVKSPYTFVTSALHHFHITK
jgi:hypothetical protein